MAKFIINKDIPGTDLKIEVEASTFKKEVELIVFYNSANQVVDAFQSALVYRVTREVPAK